MHRYLKLISLASIGSALTIAPALGATERFVDTRSERAHKASIGSPRTLTIDVPAVVTPFLATPNARTPGPTSCVGMQPIALPAGAQVRVGHLAENVSTPASTWDIGTCLTVPSASLASITVAAKTVDLASKTVAVPASVARDESGAQSSAGNGMAAAQANESDRRADLNLALGFSDISVDVAPHL